MGGVRFKQGTLAAYVALEERDPDTLYFITDRNMAFKGDVPLATARTAYVGTCDTAAATNPKVCVVEDFPLDAEGAPMTGTEILVRFARTNTSTSTTPQLDVNGTGAKRIWAGSAALATAKSSYAGYANRYIRYVYDGTYWVFAGWSVDNNTTYAAMTDAALKEGTETTARLVTAQLLKDNFDLDTETRTVTMRNGAIVVPEDIVWEELI